MLHCERAAESIDQQFTRMMGRDEALATLDQLNRDIEYDPYRPGAAGARLKRSGVPIWALISYYQQAVHENLEQTARDYELTREEVETALAFYAQNRKAIDARITANSSPVT